MLPLQAKNYAMNIIEDNDNIYIENYIIPKGIEKADIKVREAIIWSMFSQQLSCLF